MDGTAAQHAEELRPDDIDVVPPPAVVVVHRRPTDSEPSPGKGHRPPGHDAGYTLDPEEAPPSVRRAIDQLLDGIEGRLEERRDEGRS